MNADQVERLRRSVTEWNQWRVENQGVVPDLRGADLRNAHLNGAMLTKADLVGANLSGAMLVDVRFAYALLMNANLSGAMLAEADFWGADLSGASLVQADLYGAHLAGARMTDADLTGVDLTGVNHAGVTLSEEQRAVVKWDCAATQGKDARPVPEPAPSHIHFLPLTEKGSNALKEWQFLIYAAVLSPQAK